LSASIPVVPEAVRFAFRPWVRRSCRRAFLGGFAIIAALAAASALVADPADFTWRRAMQVLAGYVALFLATLAKIWWTAGKPAAVVEKDALFWQPLHRFRPLRAGFADLVAVGPRPGTESLRLVLEPGQRERFLNLGLIDRRNEFLELIGERLRRAGLEALPGVRHAFRRPGFDDPGAGTPG